MRKSILVLSIITLMIFTTSCGKQSKVINYEDKKNSTNIEENLPEEQNIDKDKSTDQNTEIEEAPESTPTTDQIDSDSTDVFDFDSWGVDWESYKTFDVSELFNVSNFLFDVITALSDEMDPLFEVTRGIAYTFTSTDSMMTSSGKERHQLRMDIGNPNKSDTEINFYSGDENEIINFFADSVKVGKGSTMYDAEFRQKGNYKVFSYKYIGYAQTKYTISGRIILANSDDSVPSQNPSKPNDEYRQKWIEFIYTSPQIAQSTDSVVTDKEIAQFDKFFDHVLESLVIED